MSEAAVQQKLAAMFAANKDDVSVPKIYIDITGGWETGAVLDELLFWTLPKKTTGKTSLRVFKQGKLWLAVRRADWWDRKRIKERQADTAIEKLVNQGLIEKDVFLFDGKPTVHLRLVTDKFVELYSEKLQEYAVEEQDENLIRDIADLYEMMGFPNKTVNSILQNGEMLNSQNREIINSPVQPENNNSAGAVIQSADRKVDAILELEKQAKQEQEAGRGWRGREFLIPEHLPYGDWWYAKTGLEMYGARGKAKVDAGFQKACKELYEFGVTIASLEEAWKANEWRKITTLMQLVSYAKAIQAAPPPIEQPEQEKGKGFYA